MEKTRICFVCLGNIIRSPLAENIFRKIAAEAGEEDLFEIDSAGTSSYHIGERPDHRMRQVAERKGLVYDGRASQFKAADFDRFDWVIAMDPNNQADLENLAGSKRNLSKIRLMREFDPEAEPRASVPDPYYGGKRGFEITYEIVERSAHGLYKAIRNGELKSSEG